MNKRQQIYSTIFFKTNDVRSFINSINGFTWYWGTVDWRGNSWDPTSGFDEPLEGKLGGGWLKFTDGGGEVNCCE